MANRDEELLKFKVGIDVDPAKKQVLEFNRKLNEMIKLPLKFEKAEKKSFRQLREDLKQSTDRVKNLKEGLDEAGKSIFGARARKQATQMAKSFGDVEKSSDLLKAVVLKNSKKVAEAQAKYARDKTKDNKEALDQAQKLAKREVQNARNSLRTKQGSLAKQMTKSGAGDTLSDQFEKAQKEAEKRARRLELMDPKKIKEEFKGALVDGARAFAGRDAKGLAESFSSLMVTSLKGAGAAGSKVKKFGTNAKEGANGGIGGAALKGIGAFAEKAGGMLQIIGKLGPAIATMSSAIMGVVKLLIDVDAAGKAMNKELLEGASLAETFASQGWNAKRGYDSLERTLQEVKDQSFDVGMNLSMGTSGKDHLNVINVLKREGITLGNLKTQLDANKESTDATVRSVKSFQDVTKMSIGYSRIFGVSLDEIGSLQSEMMTELSSNLGETNLEFSKMADVAVDSGIAANKFFGIIRGVTADLSLFGFRMKDAVKTMKLLGGVMSPRSAQRFMQTIMGTFKGKSMMDLTKDALLGGADATKAARKDVDEKMKDLLGKVKKETGASNDEEAMALLKGKRVSIGGKDQSLKDLQKSGKVQSAGTLREAYTNLSRRDKALKSGGPTGTAMALKDASGATAYEVQRAKAQNLGLIKKGGKLSDMSSFGMLAGEQSPLGLSADQVEDFSKLEQAMEDQKEVLKEALEHQEKADPKFLKKIKELGIKIGKNGEIEADAHQVMQSLESDEEDQKKHSEEQLKVAYESGKLSQSMLDKIDVIIDYVFNLLYKTMMGIWKTIQSFSFFENSKEKKDRLGMEGDNLKREFDSLTKKLSDPNLAEGARGDLINKLGELAKDITRNSQEKAMAGMPPEVARAATLLDKVSPDMAKGLRDAAVNSAQGPKKAEVAKSFRSALPAQVMEDQIKATEGVATTIEDATRRQGIKMDKTFVKGELGDQLEKSTSEGVGQALLQFQMYKDMSPSELMKNIKDSGSTSIKDAYGATKNYLTNKLNGNAQGGYVSSVGGGIANVSPAPGEGLASIGRGERIVPAGGGSSVNFTINGGNSDLAAYLKPRVIDIVREYDRRKKFG